MFESGFHTLSTRPESPGGIKQRESVLSFPALRDQVVGRIWLRAPVADAALTRRPASQVKGGGLREDEGRAVVHARNPTVSPRRLFGAGAGVCFPPTPALAAGIPGRSLPCPARAPPTFRGQGGEDGVLGGRPPHVLQDLLHRGGRRAGGQHHALPGLGAHPWRRKRRAWTRASPTRPLGPSSRIANPDPPSGLARQRPAPPVPQFPR